MAKWIWYKGDFEIYHNVQLHARREHYGMARPPFWDVPSPYNFVEFHKKFTVLQAGEFVCRAKGDGLIWLDDRFYPLNEPIPVTTGEHAIKVQLHNVGGLPCIYINADMLVTDESWTVTHGGVERVGAGCVPTYTKENDDPQVFPFAYERKDFVRKEEVDGGVLFDFGKEMFGKLVLTDLLQNETLCVYYGESREEALASTAYNECMIWECITGEKETTLKARAFRFIRLEGKGVACTNVYALYEYLPLTVRGRFSCNEKMVEKIWDICAYTFHLCSREFFLDGIKRDRWVWSGDARQSFMINDYLFADREICKRTILSLLPKDRVYQHVNTINDYSALLLISIWEYYQSFGDTEFISFVWARMQLLYEYIVGRLDENGFVVAREGDWIFIDWARMDKEGPLCAEQILLWQACVCMGRLAKAIGRDGKEYEERAENLKKSIFSYFWKEDKGAFIDGYLSGRENVTRHANIFAIAFDFVDETQKKTIYEKVLKNDEVPPITTPYFKLYEVAAICSLGDIQTAQKLLTSYWGGMLEKSATTMWEEYKPEQEIPACYAMYGEPFGKSLCHAWSSGPIYFLGRYCLGVSATAPRYEKFKVEPNPGIYTKFSGEVPTEKGRICVAYEKDTLRVYAELDGGTLVWKGKAYPIIKNQWLTI